MIIYFFPKNEGFSPENILHLLGRMPQQQQEIIGQMKNTTSRMDQIVAYVMLCQALKKNKKEIFASTPIIVEFNPADLTNRYLKTNPPLFHFGEHGKPYLTNYEGVYFNISHCREAVVVGVSGKEVGIDAEGKRSFSESLLKRAYNEEEQASVMKATEPEKEFARLWTRKEAWFKWTGTGILLDHLDTTEADATKAGCHIVTAQVTPSGNGKPFFISIAQ